MAALTTTASLFPKPPSPSTNSLKTSKGIHVQGKSPASTFSCSTPKQPTPGALSLIKPAGNQGLDVPAPPGSRLVALEKTIEHLQLQHADSLKGLHEEIHRLQNICADFAINAAFAPKDSTLRVSVSVQTEMNNSIIMESSHKMEQMQQVHDLQKVEILQLRQELTQIKEHHLCPPSVSADPTTEPSSSPKFGLPRMEVDGDVVEGYHEEEYQRNIPPCLENMEGQRHPTMDKNTPLPHISDSASALNKQSTSNLRSGLRKKRFFVDLERYRRSISHPDIKNEATEAVRKSSLLLNKKETDHSSCSILDKKRNTRSPLSPQPSSDAVVHSKQFDKNEDDSPLKRSKKSNTTFPPIHTSPPKGPGTGTILKPSEGESMVSFPKLKKSKGNQNHTKKQ